MSTELDRRKQRQRGATLAGYALVMATFTSAAMGTLNTLEDTSGEYLTNTGSSIGRPMEGREYLSSSVLANPPDWAIATTTTAPTTTTTTTAPTTTTAAPTTTTTTTAPTTAPPTTAAPTTTTAPLGPTGAKIFDGSIGAVTPGMCLVVVGNGMQQSNNCNGAPALQLHEKNGFVTISAAAPANTCFGTTSNDNGPIVNETCTEADDQLWEKIPSLNGTFQFKNKASGRCLDVNGASTSSGAQIHQWASSPGSCKPTNQSTNHNFSLTATPAAPAEVLEVNASSAVLSGGMTFSNGKVGVPNGAGNNMNNAGATTSKATFTFTVATAGNYKIFGNVSAPSGSDDSFFVTVDGAPAAGYVWGVASGATDYVNDGNGGADVIVALQPGQHTVTLHLREDGTFVSSLKLEKV